MGRIQTDVGLITGVQIGTLVQALMKLAAKPRDTLQTRTDALKKEQLAITELSALLMATRYMSDNLGKTAVFQKLKVTSSNDAVLAATLSGTPVAGSYQFTPIRTAESAQFLSAGVLSDSDPLGGGTLAYRFGDDVLRSAGLDQLGSGTGFASGRIRITDRSGASAEIDLSTARSVDDVLDAINASATINVTASAAGDRIRLQDNTGQSVTNLKVQEVGRGTTAASLGLSGIDVAGIVAEGQDILRLTGNTLLSELNDGSGVPTSPVLPDISYELRDGTTGTIDLSPLPSGGGAAVPETTLGQVLQRINDAAPGKLKAEISSDGERLAVTDLTAGAGSFKLDSLYESEALTDLGLDGPAAGGAITGRRLLGGLQTVLLSSLNGGNGLGQLGALQLTDRSGASATVDLATAETLDDVVQAIDSAGIGIAARVNDARNGILLTDTSGGSLSHLIVADGDSTQTAAKLQIAADTEGASVNSGDLHLQVISHQTRLKELNGGAGVAPGTLTIFNSKNQSAGVNLAQSGVQTIGDVIRAINRLNLDVRAEINATGDGIALVDLAGGNGRLHVESGSSTAVADLHLDRSATNATVDGLPAQVLDGSIAETIQLGAGESLADLRAKIEAAKSGVTARILNDGSTRPYRLALSSQRPGTAGQLMVDASGLNLSITETNRGRDALLLVGAPGASRSQVLLASGTNEFTNAVPGVKLQVKQPSTTPVTVQVATSDTDLVASVKTMVDNYNKLRKKLREDTAYDAAADKASVLTGDASALRLDSELSYLLSGRFFGAGRIQSLAEVGVHVKDDGTLELNQDELQAKFAADPQAVQDFFTKKDVGFSARFGKLTEQLSGRDSSMLDQRSKTLEQKISDNEARIEAMNKRLDAQQESLYLEFYNMELAVGKLQSQLSVINSIKPLDPLTISSTS